MKLLGVVAHIFNPGSQELGQEGCHKFKASQGYTARKSLSREGRAWERKKEKRMRMGRNYSPKHSLKTQNTENPQNFQTDLGRLQTKVTI